MGDGLIRRTLGGAAVGGGLFAAVSLYRSWASPGSLLDYAGPVGLMVVIGATLQGRPGDPAEIEALMERYVARREGREGDEDEGPATSEAGGGGDAGAEGHRSPRQPFWLTLLVGLAVGYGVGTAWDRVWAGLALGLVLALLARRVFR